MKVDIETVAEILQKHNITADAAQLIKADLEAQVEANRIPRERGARKPFIIVVSDPTGVIPADTELTGWVVQTEEDKGILTVMDSIHKTAYDHNATPKGERLKIETVGDTFDTASGKLFRENGVLRKHKEPVFVLITNNKVPMDKGDDNGAT